MKALLVSTDLMVVSRVENAAAGAGATVAVACDIEAAVGTVSRDPIDLVILDLTATALDVDEAVRRLRQATSQRVATVLEAAGGRSSEEDEAVVTLVAFAPHVHSAKLAAARQAGCDRVVSRGEFHRTVADLFTAAPGSPPCHAGQ